MTDREPQRGAWDPPAPFTAGGQPDSPADPTMPFDPMTIPMTGAANTFNPHDPAVYGGATPDRLQPVPRPTGYGRLPLIVAALAVLLLVGAVSGVVLLRSGNRADTGAGDGSNGSLQQLPATETVATKAVPTEATPTEATPTETPPAETSPTETPPVSEGADPQAEALAQLEALRAEGLAAVTFDGRLAAQIASKYPGVFDRFQVAADGTHTFQTTDILAEHQRLRDEHGSAEHPVILVKSTDYGKRQRTAGGQFLWVTFAIGDFPDKQAVLDWCAEHFGHLSADEFKNQCDSRNLRPPA
ncbi:hypothetical protein QLQ12_00730 [Actinoplanes sp. NEAU-A12]|uniref:Uncharacterized protein n=1 Tax=Actinoplanes sandaracinus TaxID=3045177 RepID=A0ABT6WBN1_9ACTN|nr:hypothetical protein [Actinoplanes sandaracinus]MDI6097132.1 hypothetical protein [Actinoplanes sandaracinus]